MNISDILRHKSHGDGAARDPEVITIAPDATVGELLSSLAEHNIGAVVVADGDSVAGIVSERDVVRRLAANGARALEGRVAELMTTSVRTCSSGDSVDDIAAIMTSMRIRHLPVVDDGALRAIVSIGDVVSSRIRQLEQDRGQLEAYIAG